MDENREQKNWFGRNRIWAIPSMGCLTLIVLIIIFASTMITNLTGFFKDSVPYTVGMENLIKNKLVIEALGEPIEANGMFQGNIRYNDDEGNADLKVPVKGPKGEATLLIIAVMNDDVWTYNTMEVTISDTNEIINLLETIKLIE